MDSALSSQATAVSGSTVWSIRRAELPRGDARALEVGAALGHPRVQRRALSCIIAGERPVPCRPSPPQRGPRGPCTWTRAVRDPKGPGGRRAVRRALQSASPRPAIARPQPTAPQPRHRRSRRHRVPERSAPSASSGPADHPGAARSREDQGCWCRAPSQLRRAARTVARPLARGQRGRRRRAGPGAVLPGTSARAWSATRPRHRAAARPPPGVRERRWSRTSSVPSTIPEGASERGDAARIRRDRMRRMRATVPRGAYAASAASRCARAGSPGRVDHAGGSRAARVASRQPGELAAAWTASGG